MIGLGSIGLAVARAAAGLGMHVQAWSRSLTRGLAEEKGIEYRATPADLVRDAGINIEEMENTIFRGGTTASCSLKLDRAPDADALDATQTVAVFCHVANCRLLSRSLVLR